MSPLHKCPQSRHKVFQIAFTRRMHLHSSIHNWTITSFTQWPNLPLQRSPFMMFLKAHKQVVRNPSAAVTSTKWLISRVCFCHGCSSSMPVWLFLETWWLLQGIGHPCSKSISFVTVSVNLLQLFSLILFFFPLGLHVSYCEVMFFVFPKCMTNPPPFLAYDLYFYHLLPSCFPQVVDSVVRS